MHSLKGASGFLGLNKINGLAHKAENILDELRQGSLAVNTGIMDVILAATDALRTLVDNLEESGVEGDVDTSPIIQRIEILLEGGVVEHESAAPESSAAKSAPEPAAEAAPASNATTNEARADDPAEGLRIPRVDTSVVGEPYELTTVGEGHLADFLEEAHEIIASLNQSLLELEGNTDGSELINDIFRYFHNLKGNSGIIGYAELNALTHEAETLLNRVRKGEIRASQGLIDLLLAVVDLIEAMIEKVEMSTGKASPLDASRFVALLQRVTEEGEEVAERLVSNGDVLQGDDSEPAPAMDAVPDPPAAEDATAETPSSPEETPSAASGYDPEDLSIFEQTSIQQLDNIAYALARLAEDPSLNEIVDGLYRTLTTIQNSAGYMGLDAVKVYAERTAGLVDQGRKSGIGFEMLLDMLRQECEILSDMLRAELGKLVGEPGTELAAEAPQAEHAAPEAKSVVETAAPPESAKAPKPVPEPAPKPPAVPKAAAAPEPAKASKPAAAAKPAAPASPPAAAPAKADDKQPQAAKQKVSTTIRVDHQKLDHLMNLIGELIINRGRYTMLARALDDGQQEVAEVAQQLTETTYALSRISDDLQDTIMKVRMVPVSTVFSRFPRLVRDLSRKCGKQVELITEGEDTELDKSVVEEIGDPLVHLVRNSMDHGLEESGEREAVGKSTKGHVWLRAYYKGNSVAIEVEDDGRGIDPERMRETAIRKGVITPEEAKALDDREAIELIFAPGFSSAETVTDVSGRGVGMDVVKNNIKNLKGSVHTASEVGKGTKFTLTLPLTLAIIDALMVQVAGETFAIPLDAVSETTKIETRRLTDVNNRKAVTLRGEVLGIVELSELLDMPANTEDRDILPVVVIHDNERRLGLVVDRLLERQEIVIKPLGQYLSGFNLRGLSGATIMGDGSVVLILDPHEIYSIATAISRGTE